MTNETTYFKLHDFAVPRQKDLILKIKIIENISIKKWNIWKCDGIINLNNKKRPRTFKYTANIFKSYLIGNRTT